MKEVLIWLISHFKDLGKVKNRVYSTSGKTTLKGDEKPIKSSSLAM